MQSIVEDEQFGNGEWLRPIAEALENAVRAGLDPTDSMCGSKKRC
jgi:hypothetical protein